MSRQNTNLSTTSSSLNTIDEMHFSDLCIYDEPKQKGDASPPTASPADASLSDANKWTLVLNTAVLQGSMPKKDRTSGLWKVSNASTGTYFDFIPPLTPNAQSEASLRAAETFIPHWKNMTVGKGPNAEEQSREVAMRPTLWDEKESYMNHTKVHLDNTVALATRLMGNLLSTYEYSGMFNTELGGAAFGDGNIKAPASIGQLQIVDDLTYKSDLEDAYRSHRVSNDITNGPWEGECRPLALVTVATTTGSRPTQRDDGSWMLEEPVIAPSLVLFNTLAGSRKENTDILEAFGQLGEQCSAENIAKKLPTAQATGLSMESDVQSIAQYTRRYKRLAKSDVKDIVDRMIQECESKGIPIDCRYVQPSTFLDIYKGERPRQLMISGTAPSTWGIDESALKEPNTSALESLVEKHMELARTSMQIDQNA